ncbi:MHS family MFS transporter [Kocuria sp. cx-455]|uniref:MFS transporter n=1 Tax=Kocuria sp. cx-455 TaxID=2771377 RepID=UPI001683E2E2|nr:MFS transporter [Kocuria sp. cx-455]MBD2765767.1 MHS family MFS transporter [Kocuria sp. cx-455]
MSATATPQLNQLSVQEQRKEARRVVVSSYLGSTIEFYDFLLYATAAALVFPHVFFADLDPLAATIASYGTFAAGYIARPLGGVIFGHFGDRLGRKRMLILSMLIMGVASTLIGLIPSGAVIGSWGAIILVTLRLMQGIAIGGEWGGAALMALEHAEPKKRGFAASFVNAGAPTGSALGTFVMGLFASLPEDQFLSWGWRVPFSLSAVLLIVGLVIRTKISESPIFAAAVAADENSPKRASLPIWSVIRRPKNLLLVMFGGAAGFALQVVMASFAVTYAVAHGTERQPVLYAFATASLLSVAVVVVMGKVSDRFGRRPVMLVGMVAFIALLSPIFNWLASGNILLIFLAFMVGLTCHSTIYGPLAAFISEQFGTTARYTGASVGYQMATLLGAGFTPTILATLYGAEGQISRVLLYLGILTAVSGIAILLTKESKNIDLHTYEH